MTPYEIVAQAVGIVAMVANILSYQNKSQGRLIFFQLVGGFLFAVNFFMLGAVVGGFLNVIAVIRAIVFLNREKLHAEHPVWLVGFILLFSLGYILNFTCFGQELNWKNGILELFPVVAMAVSTQSFRCKEAGMVRKYGLIVSPCWLIYNISKFAVGAIICESFSICSIVIGMIRLDRKKQKVR